MLSFKDYPSGELSDVLDRNHNLLRDVPVYGTDPLYREDARKDNCIQLFAKVMPMLLLQLVIEPDHAG
jgi:hypothetical protein